MPAPKIDPVLLRRWCKARLSAVEIAARFGVTRQAVSMACRRYHAVPVDGRKRPEPAPRLHRCLACGGKRMTGVPHRCRPSHPVTHGLQWGSR
jgi:hypothetical protein